MASTAALDLIVQMKGDAAKRMDELAEKGGGLGDAIKGGAMIAGEAIIALGGVLLNAAKAAADEQVGIDRLNGTLKNAIPNWDGNTTAVEAYINQSTKLAFQDDQLRDSLNLLVGQTHDLKAAQDIQAVAMDLSRSKNIDLEKATRLLLKADDESYAALGKLGIQIDSHATKEQALAQIHLATAGAAGVYADSAAGAAERVQNALGDAFETIGHTVLDLVQGPLGGFADWLQSDAVQAGIQQVAGFIGGALTNAFKFFGDVINAVLPIIQPFAQAWVDFFTNLSNGQPILDSLGTLFSDFGAAIVAAWDIIGPALGTIITNIWNWIVDNAPAILATLGQWAQAFWDWIVEIWPGVVAGLGTLVTNIWNWIVANGPGILAKLGEWALAFIGWILPMIPPLLVELGKIAFNIITWIGTTALPAILTKLGEWATAFLKWIWDDVLPKLPGELAKIASALWDWITKTWGELVTQLRQFAEGFWTWITDVVKGIGVKLGSIATEIWGWITGTARDILTKAKEIGTNLANGIGEGFKAAWSFVQDNIINTLVGMPAKMNAAQGAKSPATLFMPIGQYAAEGVGKGYLDKWPQVAAGMTAVLTKLSDDSKAIITAAFPPVGTQIATDIGTGWDNGWTPVAAGMVATFQKLADDLPPVLVGAFDAIQAAMDRLREYMAQPIVVGDVVMGAGIPGAPRETGGGGGGVGGPGGVIPLAAGGYVMRPTLAIVGESGPEAVIPLSQMGRHGGGIHIGPITINAGAGANGAQIASDFLNALDRELGYVVRTRKLGRATT